jgi:hypothetical protein
MTKLKNKIITQLLGFILITLTSYFLWVGAYKLIFWFIDIGLHIKIEVNVWGVTAIAILIAYSIKNTFSN